MITAVSAGTKIIVSISAGGQYRLERIKQGAAWLVWDGTDFVAISGAVPQAVTAGDFLDNTEKPDGIYTYRCAAFPDSPDYEYSNPVRSGSVGATGYSFGNYHPAPGMWGTVVTPDDMRFTYLWGTDFKAANGQSYTDEQIQYFIDAAVARLERELNITIKKQRIRCEPERRGLEKGRDYDAAESYYDFKWQRIQRYGMITTRQRPVIAVYKLDLLSRFNANINLMSSTAIDKARGLIKFLDRPLKPSGTWRGIESAIGMFGQETLRSHLFYEIDYDAGYETSDDVPRDLREIIGKDAAVGLLNVIGDGLMSGFSSSSLSMDGMSESFSSTQSATSAYFGARIKVYEDEIKSYIEENRFKFGHVPIGVL